MTDEVVTVLVWGKEFDIQTGQVSMVLEPKIEIKLEASDDDLEFIKHHQIDSEIIVDFLDGTSVDVSKKAKVEIRDGKAFMVCDKYLQNLESKKSD